MGHYIPLREHIHRRNLFIYFFLYLADITKHRLHPIQDIPPIFSHVSPVTNLPASSNISDMAFFIQVLPATVT